MRATVDLVEEECVRRFAWFPVWLDAGALAGRYIWLKYFYARPHWDGPWRPAYSIEPRPSVYVDGRTIRIEPEVWIA